MHDRKMMLKSNDQYITLPVESIRQLHAIHAGIGGSAGIDLALPAYHLLYEYCLFNDVKPETK